MIRVTVNPRVLCWARERAGRAQDDLTHKFKQLPKWETGETKPTLKQLEAFARTVHVPFGYLFSAEPPEESLPIPDFRSFDGPPVSKPSPNLLDTIYVCQERQDWYRDFVRTEGQPALDFVGSAGMGASPEAVAMEMRKTLSFDLTARRGCRTWIGAQRMFLRNAEEAGILVMVSGVVRSDTRRRLDPAEFRGLALSDPHAPLVFVNGADTKAAQLFTLAHELAHIWLGSSGLSNIDAAPRSDMRREETWCSAVAAELLVPLTALRTELLPGESLPDALTRLAEIFKVSTLVILRRLLDAAWLDRASFDTEWAREVERLRTNPRGSSGGRVSYPVALARTGRRFTRALVVSTREGHTLYRDAFRMLGVSGTEAFNNLGRRAGVVG